MKEKNYYTYISQNQFNEKLAEGSCWQVCTMEVWHKHPSQHRMIISSEATDHQLKTKKNSENIIFSSLK